MINPLKRIYPLIEEAIKTTGNYNPSENIPRFVEQLTSKEYQLVDEFLSWVYENGHTFGRGNFDEMYGSYIDSLKQDARAMHSR